MSYPYFAGTILGGTLLLCACASAPAPSVSSHDLNEHIYFMRTPYSVGPMAMLELGRVISHGSVDVYDPFVSSFMVLPPSRSVASDVGTIPYNHGVVVRDKAVRVYSLVARAPTLEIPAMEPAPVSDPIPLSAE